MRDLIIKHYKTTILFIVSFCTVFNSVQGQTQKNDTIRLGSEQLINIAYGKQPEWMITGSISDYSDVSRNAVFSSNFTSTLSGRIPGLTVMLKGAEPGYESNTLISRGLNTFGVSSSRMLLLVDGVEANMADLIPEEVASVTLLKDAASTAMYGSRGANGVLLITTKRGEEGKLKVAFSSQYGLQSPVRLPQFLNSYDYARLYNEALVNDGKQPLYTSDQLQLYKNGEDPYFYPDVNWHDVILRDNAPLLNNYLSFTGGSGVAKYYVLLSHINNQSLYRKTGDESEFSINGSYQRFNFRSNVDINIGRRFTANFTLGGTVVDKANPADNNTDGIFRLMAMLPPNAFPVYNPNGTLSRNSVFQNPLGDILLKGFYTSNGRTLISIAGFKYDLDFITQGLSISSKISFNSYFLSQSNKYRNYESFALSKNAQGETVYTKFGLNTSLVGSEGSSDQYRNVVYQTFLNYDRVFDKHRVSSVLMYNFDEFIISGNNFPVKHINVSGRGTYAYKEKYIGEVSFSYMGSENFPKGSRFGLFPAVSAGWIVSNEGFLRNNSTINYMKLRASYGMVGNDQIGGTRFMFEQYYPYTSSYFFGTANSSIPGIIQGSPANRNVTWEKEKIVNLGFEAELFKNFSLSVDFYNRDRYHILVIPNQIPDVTGFIKPHLNEGKTNNKGFEGKLGYRKISPTGIEFWSEATLWYHKNKIVYNGEALQLYDYLYRTGNPINQPFGLVAVGFFKDQADIQSSPRQIWTAVKPGDVKYKDQNNDSVIDQNDIYPIGKGDVPNLSAGLNLGLKIKSFDVEMFLHGVADRSVYLSGLEFEAFQNNGKISSFALNRWTPETHATANYPRLSSMNNDNNFRYSTLWQRDGSFVKLRSIEVGYTLPANLTSRINLQNIRIFANGTNLFSLDRMEGFADPEIISGYPTTRIFSLGLKVQFR